MRSDVAAFVVESAQLAMPWRAFSRMLFHGRGRRLCFRRLAGMFFRYSALLFDLLPGLLADGVFLFLCSLLLPVALFHGVLLSYALHRTMFLSPSRYLSCDTFLLLWHRLYVLFLPCGQQLDQPVAREFVFCAEPERVDEILLTIEATVRHDGDLEALRYDFELLCFCCGEQCIELLVREILHMRTFSPEPKKLTFSADSDHKKIFVRC